MKHNNEIVVIALLFLLGTVAAFGLQAAPLMLP